MPGDSRLTCGEVVALVVLFVISAAISFSLVGGGHSRVLPNRAVCRANIRDTLQAMNLYAFDADDSYPIAGIATPDGRVQGFAGPRDAEWVAPDDPRMANNVTASQWMLLRNGLVRSKVFVCPSSGGRADEVHEASDWATRMERMWDFESDRNLSYSVVNMYHPANDWTANVAGDAVLMGDDNNADGEGIHRLTRADEPTHDEVKLSNSRNHYEQGQEIGYGDGHVSFESDPFQGPHDDNVYAMIDDGENVPPRLGNAAGDMATDSAIEDAVLIPVTGNNGESISGVATRRKRPYMTEDDWNQLIGLAVCFGPTALGFCLILLERRIRRRKIRRGADPFSV